MKYSVYVFDPDGEHGRMVSNHRKYGPAERMAVRLAMSGKLTDLRQGNHVVAAFHPDRYRLNAAKEVLL